MVNLETKARQCLREFDLRTLFIEEMGWDRHVSSLEVFVDSLTYNLSAVAQKRGMLVFVCSPSDEGPIPDYSTRRKIERQVAKSVHEHLIIFMDKDRKYQIWQWVKREVGKPAQCREHAYYCNQPGDSLLQKINAIAFNLNEEEGLTVFDVTSRIQAGFDLDKVTKKFYDRFKSEHDTFLKFLEGIPDEEMQRWYVSVMLNRLMFIYFIQRKGFLDSNIDYLHDKLSQSKRHGKNRFYKDFLCPLFFEGFAKKENERNSKINKLLGKVPFLNGGIFQRHQIEELHGSKIQISDAAFEKLFNFFDQYQWHLDERPLRADDEINPDVLGYIFEKYVNQKQMGAYYTKEDITEYISKNTIIPYLFDEAKKKCKIAFEGEQSVWHLLQSDPNRYIYDAVKKGVDLPLPQQIALGLDNVSKRTEWNKPAPEEYALPTEIWREAVARRQRYEEFRSKILSGEIQDINDFITYNLNIRQFAQDVIENCEGPELLRAFWHAIEQVSILDPTCGSGAFLFAALNILEPLYEACLERMEIFLQELEHSGEKHRPEKFSDFRKVLERIEKHPNRRYFIFKSIIVNNLYGVDIMEEAIEICKLRLFLKLVAQIDQVESIEPLPDIDFNIRGGNTLVGYATYDEVKKAVLGDAQGKLDLGKDMQRIDEKAQDVDRLFKLFREQQTELGGEVTPAEKQELQNRLKALEEELNRYLAGEYGIDPDKKASYEKWLVSHKPFHWFIEFYGIVQKRGGFNAIIGNPPYVEYSKVKGTYTIRGYKTQPCDNLYGFAWERSLRLAGHDGQVGMIVPVSSVCTEGFESLQTLLLVSGTSVISSFNDRPGKLFEGLEHNRLCIILFQKGRGNYRTFSTMYNKWQSVERPQLFQNLLFTETTKLNLPGSFAKIGSPLEYSIVQKLNKNKIPLGNHKDSKGCFKIFYTRKLSHFVQILDFVPNIIDDAGRKREPSELKQIGFRKETERDASLGLLNSNLFYWFITVYSDCRNLNRREIDAIKFDLEKSDSKLVEGLTEATKKLMADIRGKSKDLRITYRNLGTLTIQCTYPKYSKPIIDKIDHVLAKHYGFTDEELDFIINYDIKYRVGLGGKEIEEEDN